MARQAAPVAEDAAQDGETPPAIVITAIRDQAETSFKADRSDTATRSGASLHDVPGSVTVITSKVIESQQLTSIQDVLRNVSGIKLTQSPQSVPTFQVRGFGSTSTTNGVVDGTSANTNVFGVERVEVLKGPQAILAGANAMGGGVNVVLKKPQAETIRDVTLQYGSGGDKTGAADLSGAITADKRLTFRVIGSKTRADHNDAGYQGRQEEYLLPQLRWKDASTDLIAGVSYGTQYASLYASTFARRDGAILPQPRQLLSSFSDGFDSRQKKVFYQFEQKLAADIVFISRWQRTLDTLQLHVYSPAGLEYARGAAPDSPNAAMSFYGSRMRTDTGTTSGDHYVRAAFATWGARHKLSAGFNHSNMGYDKAQWSAPSVRAEPYGAAPSAIPDAYTASITPAFRQTYRQEQKALFVQDLISAGKWDLLLNVRRTEYDLKPAVSTYFMTPPTPDFIARDARRQIGTTTPGGGIVYKVTPQTSLYASYGKGFNPQASQQCGGGLVPPIETTNKEAGAKFDLLDSRLMLTASAFTLAQSNQLQYQPLGQCYDVRNAQKTKGVEFDVQGRLAQGWDIIANYTYNTIRDVGDPAAFYPGIPRHKASLWTTYALPAGGWKGFSAGFGVTASSSSPGTYDTVYPYTLPGQAQVDANLNWQQRNWSVIAGVKNLGDRVLYGSSSSASFVPLLPGRQFMLTVKHSFQ